MVKDTASLPLPTCAKALIPGNLQAHLTDRINRIQVIKEVSLTTEQEAILDLMEAKIKYPQIKELKITLTIGQEQLLLQG